MKSGSQRAGPAYIRELLDVGSSLWHTLEALDDQVGKFDCPPSIGFGRRIRQVH
jgi:hypothetical protein